jgi:hypothetical protein
MADLCRRSLVAAIALSLPLASLGAQEQVGIDWDVAVATFNAHRPDGLKPPKGKRASRCAAYWVTHLGALNREAFVPEAIAKFDAELASGDEAGLNALVFSRLTSDQREYIKGKNEAEAMLARLLTGERESLVSYFKQLARCSMGAG